MDHVDRVRADRRRDVDDELVADLEALLVDADIRQALLQEVLVELGRWLRPISLLTLGPFVDVSPVLFEQESDVLPDLAYQVGGDMFGREEEAGVASLTHLDGDQEADAFPGLLVPRADEEQVAVRSLGEVDDAIRAVFDFHNHRAAFFLFGDRTVG